MNCAECEGYSQLGFNAVYTEVCQHWSYILPVFSTLKMEAVCSSKTLINLYQTMQCHIPEDSNFHRRSHENLKV